jgi:hypothetical protein
MLARLLDARPEFEDAPLVRLELLDLQRVDAQLARLLADEHTRGVGRVPVSGGGGGDGGGGGQCTVVGGGGGVVIIGAVVIVVVPSVLARTQTALLLLLLLLVLSSSSSSLLLFVLHCFPFICISRTIVQHHGTRVRTRKQRTEVQRY